MENQVRQTVKQILQENNLKAEIRSCELDYETFYRVEVEVDRQDYDRAFTINHIQDNFSIAWCQKTPQLVPAEPGNFVLIYDDYTPNDDESPIGLVSSKFINEKEEICYGCRYIQIALDNQWLDRIYNFGLTQENYGGYPTGFLKVLTPQETLNHLQQKLRTALKKEIETANVKYERCTQKLPDLIQALSNTQKVKSEKIEIADYTDFLLSLKIEP